MGTIHQQDSKSNSGTSSGWGARIQRTISALLPPCYYRATTATDQHLSSTSDPAGNLPHTFPLAPPTLHGAGSG